MHFTLRENVGKWRPTQHPYRFYFNQRTKFMPQPNGTHPLFPLTTYKFTSFEDVMNSPDIDGADLIDIIGVYNPSEPVKKPPASEGPSTWCSFQLRDLQNKVLNCTLWNEYVDQLDTYLLAPRQNPIVVLLQLCRINKR
ncbi:unnamed protein product [Cuscuta epithymum]|uniref:Replication protein A OB domain-containing protein n=1 Tax=Cuscuta epithymum TaxID=186058 RepID=A0AAV0D2Q6_9ASTE|nr:unnamed protein product [Cuscuta epithymum]